MKRPDAVDVAAPDAINRAVRNTVRRLVERSTAARAEATVTEFLVPHNLGEIPMAFGYNPWAPAMLYATEDMRTKWTKDFLVLAATDNVPMTIWAEAW